MTTPPRRFTWLVTLSTLFFAAYAYSQVASSFGESGISRCILSIIMGALGLLSVFLSPVFTHRTSQVLAVLLPAIFIRLLVMESAPSDDVYRYIWEGNLVTAGENPYAFVADDPARTSFRDSNWEQMNNRDQPTAYPPLTLATFALINKLGYSPASYQWVFGFLDFTLITCILSLLHRFQKPLKWAALYALSPLSFLAFAAEAHFDILMMLPFFFGILCFSYHRYIAAALCLAIAIHFKLMVAVAIPFFIWRTPPKAWIAFSVALCLPLIPLFSDYSDMLAGVAHFGSIANFNGPIYQCLNFVLQDEHNLDRQLEIANLSTAVIYAAIWLSIAILFLRKKLTPISAATSALATLLLLSPVIHFWYLAWVLPFIVLSPRLSWLTLSVTSGLYFLVWHHFSATGDWALPVFARWLFWLPLLALSAWEKISSKRLFNTTVRRSSANEVASISIIIPAFNAGNKLAQAIDSITQQSHQPLEVIIVDAGSTDGSLNGLTGVEIISSRQGRGVQIKTGLESAKANWALILHADAELSKNSLATLTKHIEMNPEVVGGCLGQRFDHSGAGLLFVEVLNELRATFSSTSFGDQAQFVHLPTAIENNCLSDQPLMEDVELSDRLHHLGEISYLGNEAVVSAEKWIRHPFWERFSLVVRYFFRYRLMLWKSAEQREMLANQLVHEYYSAANK